MTTYNLTPRQKDVLRAIVADFQRLGCSGYLYDGAQGGIILLGGQASTVVPCIVECSPDDLERFRKLDLLDGPSWNEGQPTQLAYDAVAANFVRPDPPAAHATNIGVQVNGPAHGQIQGTAGTHNRPVMNVAAGDAGLIGQLAQVTAELCEVVRQVLPVDAASQVVLAAEGALDEASQEKPHAGAVASGAGATVTAVMKNIATVGAAADGAAKVGQLLSAVTAWLYVHGSLLASLPIGRSGGAV